MEELPTPPALRAIEEAFNTGNTSKARQLLVSLSDEDRAVLALELGEEAVGQLTRSAARGPRRQRLGRVVVLNGIMGATLDRRLKARDERIWIHALRLIAGQFRHLRLNAAGGPSNPKNPIVVSGLHKEYWQLQLELEEHWYVLPFAYDWRLDIDRSADALAQRIRNWSQGEPVHIVAHSMGGLVARRMIYHYPDLWASMDDPDGHQRGGRLIMLGTPNRGSFAITLTLTGEEKQVRRLERWDLDHDLPAILSIISTFPGAYQMLPTPGLSVGDDRQKLFSTSAWGAAVQDRQELLDGGKRFQEEMMEVQTPDRLIYVAGYDFDTPHRIRIDEPGKFSYQETRDGDGRVPHELGLLPGVPTYWVREVHGRLPQSKLVLEDIHQLLATGTPELLESAKPTLRWTPDQERWRPAEEITVPAALESSRWDDLEAVIRREAERAKKDPAKKSRGRGGSGKKAAAAALEAAKAQAIVEAALTGGWLGDETPAALRNLGARPKRKKSDETSTPPLKLEVEVVWGDIRRVPGDVYCVGHYQGVPPQNAEYALDTVVSGLWKLDEPKQRETRAKKAAEKPTLVLGELTARGILTGELGQVTFYPWSWDSIEKLRHLASEESASEKSRRKSGQKSSAPEGQAVPTVAIAGMGYPGTFNEARLRRLARNLAWTIGLLPHIRQVCTVLIGSGDGGLTVAESVRGMLKGMRDTLTSGILSTDVEVRRLCIVEHQLDRAYEIYDALRELEESYPSEFDLEVPEPSFTPDLGGRLSDDFCLSLALGALRRALDAGKSDQELEASIHGLLRQYLAHGDHRLQSILEAFDKIDLGPQDTERNDEFWDRLARRLRVQHWTTPEEKDDRAEKMPARISFIRDGKAMRVAAIQSSAVVPERVEKLDFRIIEELIDRLTDPSQEELEEYGSSLDQLLIPRDFRSRIRFDQKLVFEVDRQTARIPFEMLPRNQGGTGGDEPYLALDTPVSRQLRTTYSPPPVVQLPTVMRALVIGDPGDPKLGHDLPGAREEARRGVELLRSRGWEVDARIGVPVGRDRLGDEPGFLPASRLEVLNLLNKNQYDLLHYCGHGDFDPKEPERAGWRFKDGLLTAAELEKMDRVPQLVVANACLTSQLSRLLHGGGSAEHSEIGLLPTLADEFFRRGVRNYIGTAWAINDAGAVLFMEELYGALLPTKGKKGLPLGEALRTARKALWDRRRIHGSLWAAYHHYGDPGMSFEAGEKRE